MPLASDPAQLQYAGGVPSIGGSSVNIRPLYASGTAVVDQPVPTPSGIIQVERYFQFSAYPAGALASGAYRLGVACTDAAGDAQRIWQVTVGLNVDLSGALTSYSAYASPLAPLLSNPGSGVSHTLSGTVSVTASSPDITSVVITATSTDGGAPGSLSITNLQNGLASFSIGGLTNGHNYVVTATATNGLAVSPVSNTLSVLVYDVGDLVAVGNLIAIESGPDYLLTWTAPPGITPSGYDIDMTPSVAGAPFFTASPTLLLSGLNPAGNYTVTVTPRVDPPHVGMGNHITIVARIQGPGQTLSAERPVGILALTQTCGRFGALPAEPASPGFPALPALGATGAGFAPTIDLAHTTPDPGFGQYPYPAVPIYPTYCAIDLGNAQLVDTGPEAGKYFAAIGRLNQVTVFDTRDTDVGWTVTATATNFTSAGSSFSGNFLGWTPVAATASSAVTGGGYQQLVTPGEPTLPDIVNGLASGARTLGQAPPEHGLGMALLDARLKVLIPASAGSGVFHSIITITVI